MFPNHVLLSEIEKLVDGGKVVILRVKGNSMFPFIKGDCDRVVLRKPGSLRIGDIVLARLSEEYRVLHRIVKIDNSSVVLMGDGNLRGMEYCKQEEITGQVIRIIRDGYYVDCMSGNERRKARAWYALLPVRRYLLAILRRINKTNII